MRNKMTGQTNGAISTIEPYDKKALAINRLKHVHDRDISNYSSSLQLTGRYRTATSPGRSPDRSSTLTRYSSSPLMPVKHKTHSISPGRLVQTERHTIYPDILARREKHSIHPDILARREKHSISSDILARREKCSTSSDMMVRRDPSPTPMTLLSPVPVVDQQPKRGDIPSHRSLSRTDWESQPLQRMSMKDTESRPLHIYTKDGMASELESLGYTPKQRDNDPLPMSYAFRRRDSERLIGSQERFCDTHWFRRRSNSIGISSLPDIQNPNLNKRGSMLRRNSRFSKSNLNALEEGETGVESSALVSPRFCTGLSAAAKTAVLHGYDDLIVKRFALSRTYGGRHYRRLSTPDARAHYDSIIAASMHTGDRDMEQLINPAIPRIQSAMDLLDCLKEQKGEPLTSKRHKIVINDPIGQFSRWRESWVGKPDR